jgi:signal transduction histidine kinase
MVAITGAVPLWLALAAGETGTALLLAAVTLAAAGAVLLLVRLPLRGREQAELHAARCEAERDELRVSAARLGAERTALLVERDGLRRERGMMAERAEDLRAELSLASTERGELAARSAALKENSHATIVNLSLRSLTLVERQLALIEGLESREEDPDQLESLFRLDHLATRMRRNNENVLVLSDAPGRRLGEGVRPQQQPVPLLEALRAAVSEIERFERVTVQFLPRVRVHGRCADDLGHLLAELLENATAFSPPDEEVAVSGWVLDGEADSGASAGAGAGASAGAGGAGDAAPKGVMLCVEDRGIGILPERMRQFNAQLADGAAAGDVAASRSMGLFVVARLAARHGVRVQLREASQGGTTAVVVIPAGLLVPEESARGRDAAGGAAGGSGGSGGAAGSGATFVPGAPVAPSSRNGGTRRSGGPRRSARVPAPSAAGVEADPQVEQGTAAPAPAAAAAAAPPDVHPAVVQTSAGLPKRMPRSRQESGPGGSVAEQPPPEPRDGPTGAIAADMLRRRLGGFQRGSQDGRRDIEQFAAREPAPDNGAGSSPARDGEHE